MPTYRLAIDNNRNVIGNLGTRTATQAAAIRPQGSTIVAVDVDRAVGAVVRGEQGWWVDSSNNLQRATSNPNEQTLNTLIDSWLAAFRQHHRDIEEQSIEYGYNDNARQKGHNRLKRHQRGIWRLIHSSTLTDDQKKQMLQITRPADVTSADDWWSRFDSLADRTTDGVFCWLRSDGVVAAVNLADSVGVNNFTEDGSALTAVRPANTVPARILARINWTSVNGID